MPCSGPPAALELADLHVDREKEERLERERAARERYVLNRDPVIAVVTLGADGCKLVGAGMQGGPKEGPGADGGRGGGRKATKGVQLMMSFALLWKCWHVLLVQSLRTRKRGCASDINLTSV
jgi:hypothetical protein